MEKENKNRKLNIVLAEYINRNLGDTIIAECARGFVEKALQNVGIKDYMIHDYNMYQEDMEYIRRADAVIFAGGGLIKYKREEFYKYVPDIIEAAAEKQIPVFINCTGVEGYDENDARCQRLKKAINHKNVKGITVRDDYQTFEKYYLEEKKEWVGKVIDPAAFSAEVYGIFRKPDAEKIGLGIVRHGLFSDYGVCNITKQFQLDFWKEIIINLEELGFQWEIFNNGLYTDYEFGLEVLEYAGVGQKEKYIQKRPAEGAELTRLISGYKGIIAARLHTNIVAFSTGCPSIGLVWNEKLVQWGEGIGYPERFIRAENMRPQAVVRSLLKAMEEGCEICDPVEKNKILAPLCGFLKKYGSDARGKVTDEEKTDWENILVATALGGKNNQFAGMNSPDTIMESYKNGFRLFEVDLKLTSDGRLVCANGWTEGTFRKLGWDKERGKGFHCGIEYEQFIKAKYYNGHYRTMDWEMLVGYVDKMKDSRFILDIRNHTNGQMQKLKMMIKRDLDNLGILQQRLILKVMKREELEAVRDMGMEIMYEIPTETEMEETGSNVAEIQSLCRDRDLSWISIRNRLCSTALIAKLKTPGRKIFVSPCNQVSEIVKWLSAGADMLGTDYQSVCKLEALLG